MKLLPENTLWFHFNWRIRFSVEKFKSGNRPCSSTFYYVNLPFCSFGWEVKNEKGVK